MRGRSALAETLGAELEIPVPRKGLLRYVDLDCAATTPVLTSVWTALTDCAPYYGSIHRGAGYKSLRSTEVFEDSLATIRTFAGGSERDSVLLSTNTTTALNYLARVIRLPRDAAILYSDQEHSSNVLPWWKHWRRTMAAPSHPDGSPDLEGWEDLLKKESIGVVAVSAASNVTGRLVDVHGVARLAHRYGAKVAVDASQLAGHRKIERRGAESEDHLDFVAFCGHKMYAPFGVGVLIGPTAMLENEWPDAPGGGTVKLIEGRSIVWADFPAREYSGTQNFFGVVALAEACKVLSGIGFDKIAEHESALLQCAQSCLSDIPGLRLLRPPMEAGEGLPIFPFCVDGYGSNLVGAYLGAEHAIGVRTGYLCQYDQVSRLLELSADDRKSIFESVRAGSMRRAPGIVRASAGLASTVFDFERLAEALGELSRYGPRERYLEEEDGLVRLAESD